MDALNFILALVALIVAVLAYQRAGWSGDLKGQIDSLGSITDSLREKTANVLARIEKMLRKEEDKVEEGMEKVKATEESDERRGY